MTNARQFLDEIAGILRAAGRTVEIEETQESFGTFVWNVLDRIGMVGTLDQLERRQDEPDRPLELGSAEGGADDDGGSRVREEDPAGNQDRSGGVRLKL